MSRTFGWTPEHREKLRALVAAGNAAREIAPVFGLSRKSVIDAVRRYNLGPWIAKPGSKPGDIDHIPADFAELWQTHTQVELVAHYHRAASTISLWVKRLNLVRSPDSRTVQKLSMPADFKAAQAGLTIMQLCTRYGVGRDRIRRWLAEAGINRGEVRLIKPNAYMTAPVDRVRRDTTRAGMAASFMQRQGWIVYRCNEIGRQMADGPKWRCGSVVITDADLIARAERKGWDGDAWARVA